MTQSNIAIIGSGIAGLSICHWLLQSNTSAKIHLFYDLDPMMASNAPTLLFHPFPGRSVNPPAYLSQAVQHSVHILEEWQRILPRSIRKVPILRPLTPTNGKRLEQSFHKWWNPPSKDLESTASFEYVASQEIQDKEPLYQIPYDALEIRPSYSIDGADVISGMLQYFSEKGVVVQQQHVENIQQYNEEYRLNDDPQSFHKVVLALGRQSHDWFPHLDISVQGGALLQSPLPTIHHNLSMDGLHLGQHANGNWVIGSTRWDEEPSIQSQIGLLIDKLHKVLPNIKLRHECHSSKDLWMGMRCIYGPDRLPLMGALPHHRNIFVLTALGSKGWLWGPYAAKLLCNLLQDRALDQRELTLFDLMRANAEDGWYSPNIHFESHT